MFIYTDLYHPSLYHPSFIAAIPNPLSISLSSDVLSRSFAHLPADEREGIIADNQWAVLGRRVASYLSALPTSELDSKRSLDTYGSYINIIGHVLTSAILKNIAETTRRYVENSPHTALKAKKQLDTTSYNTRVEQAMLSIFEQIERNNALILKEQNFSQELNKIDVPEKKWELEPLTPLSLSKETLPLLTYLKKAQAHFHDDGLNIIIRQLERDDTIRTTALNSLFV